MRAFDSQAKKIDKSLKYSIADGSAYSAMQGLTQDYIAPFALALQATIAQVGLLSSIPSLTMALSQFAAPRLTEKAGSRKRLILTVAFLHALMWLPILLIPYIFPAQKIWWLIGLVALSTVLGSIDDPAWGSMMADLVPAKNRGTYFGFRGKVCGLVTLILFFVGGTVLHFSATNIFLGFSLLFGGALVFRLVSCFFLSKMYEPPVFCEKVKSGSTQGIIRDLGSSNLGRFIIGVSAMRFTVNLASPFFAVFMLNELKVDYITYVIVIATATMANLTFMSFWGKRADRAGNIKVLKVTSVLVPLVPLLWVVSHQLYCLVVIQIVSGFAWAGFNLASSNFIYDASRPEHRMRYIAVSNATNGIAVCLGAVLGGLLVPRLPPLFGHSMVTLFLISGLLRALVAALLLRRISEVRQVRNTNAAELLFGRPSLSPVRGDSQSQPVFHPIPPLPTDKVPLSFSLTRIWRHELTVPSWAPP
jgi:MFS family permease